MTSKPPKNIFIVGAQCTGKTTLLKALKEYYKDLDTQPGIISEVARTVMKQLDMDRNDIEFSPERSLMLQKSIMQAQYKAETELSKDSTGWYISDRSGIDPIVYARMFVGEEAARDLLDLTIWTTLEQNMKAGVVFICEAGASWLFDDGTRLMPKDEEDWNRSDQEFRRLLNARHIDYTVVPRHVVDIADRVGLVVSTHRSTNSPR